MRALIAAVAVLCCASSAYAATTPFNATYAVSRDGKVIGEARISLTGGGENWTLTTETHGTAGMVRMLGLDVSESSQLRRRDGQFETVSYDYKQDAAIKHKQRHIQIEAGQAHVADNGKNYDYPVDAGTLDRHAVSLALGEALAAGSKDARFSVAVKDHVEQQNYRVAGEEELKLPAGNFHTQRVERVDGKNKVQSWYAVGKAPMPVRLEQAQGDDSVIVMELKSGL